MNHRRRRPALLWVAAFVVLSNVVHGDEPGNQVPLEYRRYFVPADRPQDWPKRSVPYLPVDRDEFERLVEAANSVPLGKPAAGIPEITKAAYEATLVENDRLSGEARFEISASRNAPVLMPLGPFGLVLEAAAWQGSPATDAVIGVDAKDRLSVLVEHPGTLLVRWSMVGHREPDGSLRFPLELPPAMVARMKLTLPLSMTPAIAAGVLTADGPADNRHQWEFELGGRGETSLVVTPDESQSRRRRLTLLQEHVNYRFTPGGLEVAAQLRLDIHHEPLRRLDLELDGGLQMVAVQQGGGQLSWTVSEGQTAGSSRAALEFAEPLLGPGRTVTVTALAPLILNKAWTLPRIRVQGVFWQEGSASLIVPAPLSLDQLLPLRCRQLTSAPLASARPSDTFDLQFFSPDASAKVLFSWRRPLANLSLATTVALSAELWRAEFHGRFESDEGECFALSADVAEGWLIESVTSLPHGAVSTWNIEEIGGVSSLVVQLAEPLSASRPLELHIGGRRSASTDESFSESVLQMVDFHDVAIGERLLALAPEGPYQILFEGAATPRLLRLDDLTASQRNIAEESSFDAWIDLNEAQPGWAATLRPQSPRYSAEIVAEALLTDERLVETYRIRCKPEGARLDRMLVHFGQSRSSPPRWTLPADLGPIAPTRVAGARDVPGETWEVRLLRPSEKPFELRASRETAWDDTLTLGLAALDGATSQQGVLRVHAEGTFPEIAAADRLVPLPLEPDVDDDRPTADRARLCAVYRYDPLIELGVRPPAAVVRHSPLAALGAVVWNVQLRSQYFSSGRVSHTALLQLQSKGQTHCSFRLPAEVELVSVQLGGAEIRPDRGDNGLQVSLPRDEELSVLSIEYAAAARPLGLTGCCQAIWPEIDLPVMSHSWTVAVPQAYGPWDEPTAATGFDWRKRLFGPLGRAAGDQPFDPRRGDGWRDLALGFSSLDRWDTHPVPWISNSQTSGSVVSETGWNELPIAWESGPTATAWFVHRDAIEVARWAMAAVVAGAGLSLRSRPAAWMAVGGLAAIAVLWLPSALAPLASAVWLGALTCFIGQLCRPGRREQPADRQGAADRPSSASQCAAIVSVVLLLVFGTGRAIASADDQPAAPSDTNVVDTNEDPIHRVFVPVDSHGKPGTRYQVPTDFLQALRQRAGMAAEQPRGWLLTAAHYDCTLGRSESESRLVVTNLSVEYGLRVFQGESQVRIPFSRAEAALVADSATLDRQPMELKWDNAGQALVCDVDEPGDYRLQFRLLPNITDRGEAASFELAVPRVPSSRLELTAPVEAMPIEVPGARGTTKATGDGRHLSVVLGPAPQLTVRWPQRLSSVAPVAEVEELLWLKVQPGSVVVDVHLNYKVVSGLLRRVELAADHRLWRIPGGEDELHRYTEHTSPGEPSASNRPQVVQLDLASPVRDQLSLNLSWLLTGSSGVGNLRLPAFEVVGARPVKRWLAVTVDSALEYDIHNDERLEGLAPTDFAASWGEPEAALLRDAVAYRLSEGQNAWSLATRPREPQTTVKENLLLSFDQSGALVEYEAQLRTIAGFVFEHRLIVPPDLRIDQVSLEEDGSERAARWGRGESGTVAVFLDRRVTGPQRLLLRGRLPLPPDGRLPLPRLTIEPGDPEVTSERAEVLARTIHVYRQPSAEVTLTGARGLLEVAEPGVDRSNRRLGRLVGAYNAANDCAATLAVAPNEPRLHSTTQLTSLNYLDRSWTAQCDVQFTVDDGVLDAVRFDVPANWTGPFDVSPAAIVELVDQAGKNRKQLVVLPRAPLHGRAVLTIEAPLKSAPGDPIAAPDVVPLNLPNVERFLALPTHVGLEPVSWDTAHLVAAPLPESLGQRAAAETFATYRAVGENLQATLNTANRSVDTARVRLADFGVSCDDGRWRAVAAFDVEPGGRTSCPLRLSSDWHLLEVWVEGVAAAPLPTVDGQWQVPLHSARLPQRIEVMAAGPASSTGRPQLPPISAGELPVQETLLSISLPPDQKSLGDLIAAESCDSAECARVRVDVLAALIDLPQAVIATMPHNELAAWFRPWARRLIEANELRHRLAAPAASLGKATLGDEWLVAARRLQAEPLLKSLAASSPAVSQAVALWQEAHNGRPTVHFHVRGAGSFAGWHGRFSHDGRLRMVFTVLIFVVCLIAIAALRHATVIDSWRRWPQLMLAIAGLGWWLCLEPSALGFLLIAVSLWSAWRSAWRPAWNI